METPQKYVIEKTEKSITQAAFFPHICIRLFRYTYHFRSGTLLLCLFCSPCYNNIN